MFILATIQVALSIRGNAQHSLSWYYCSLALALRPQLRVRILACYPIHLNGREQAEFSLRRAFWHTVLMVRMLPHLGFNHPTVCWVSKHFPLAGSHFELAAHLQPVATTTHHAPRSTSPTWPRTNLPPEWKTTQNTSTSSFTDTVHPSLQR